jgi:hypothetical protein
MMLEGFILQKNQTWRAGKYTNKTSVIFRSPHFEWISRLATFDFGHQSMLNKRHFSSGNAGGIFVII